MSASLEYVRAMILMLTVGSPGWRFYNWLVEYGQDMQPGSLPDDFPEYLPTRPKDCYKNALFLAQHDPSRYIYCEGIATNMIPVSHAWCLDIERGCVVDPTWSSLGRDTESYLGIPFVMAFVTNTILKYGCYGLAWGNHSVANDWLDNGVDWGKAIHHAAADKLVMKDLDYTLRAGGLS